MTLFSLLTSFLLFFSFIRGKNAKIDHQRPRPGMKSPRQRMREQQQRQDRISRNSHKQEQNVNAERVIYVNGAREANGNGESWNTAYNNIQSALVEASNENQIWVAQGTYAPSITSGDTDSTFVMSKNNLYLYGGFKGDETSADERDPSLYLTVLSGKIGMQCRKNIFIIFIVD